MTTAELTKPLSEPKAKPKSKTKTEFGTSAAPKQTEPQKPLQKPVSELTSREVGIVGEKLFESFALSKNYEILERNWKCSFGEVDCIIKDGNEVGFVEIKTRVKRDKNEENLIPELAVTRAKRDKYKKLIAAYMANHPDVESARFDAVGITIASERMAHLHYICGIDLED